jgi:hypothetical protein
VRWVISAGVVLSVVLLVLSGPFGSAASPTIFSSPYTGGLKFLNASSSVILGKCTAGTTGAAFKSTSANLTTGIVLVDTTAKISGNCASGGSSQATAKAGIRSPVFNVSTSGRRSVSFNWTLDWSANAKWNGNSNACAVGFVIGFIWDLTSNGPVFNSRKAIGFVTAGCSSPGSFSGENTSKIVSVSPRLTSGHAYRLVTLLEVSVSAVLTGAGSGTASVDVAFGGENAVLSSMTVS